MYGRYTSNSIPSLLDMPPVDRSEHTTRIEGGREEDDLREAGTRQQLQHHQGSSLLDHRERSSLLGDPDFRPSVLSAASSSFSERNVGHHFATQSRVQPGPRGQPSHHSVLQESPTDHLYRERERHLDFSSGKMGLIKDDNLYMTPATQYQQPTLIAREQNLSLELERQDRERQRKADLQRRAELQREVEMERENLRRQKEEEEREAARQREMELERQRRIQREQERERELQRQALEERERKSQMEQERERLRLQLEREESDRLIKRQQKIIQERQLKIQQNYEANAKRKRLDRGVGMDRHNPEIRRISREMEILRNREAAALEQEMAFRETGQDIPSLLSMPKISPSSSMKKGLLGDIKDGLDDALMEKVRLQQAMLAQQNSGRSPNQKQMQKQFRNFQGKTAQRKRQRERAKRKGSNNSERNQKQNSNSKKQTTKSQQPDPKTPPWLQDGAFESSKSKKDNAKTDLYDPLHPTEDDETTEAGGKKRKRSDGELQVRIHQDNENRDVLDPPHKKRPEIPSSGNIHPTKEMLLQMRGKMSSSLEWICHVCNIKCHEVMNYNQHMMGKRHQAMMSHIIEVAEAKTIEALNTFRAENHVKRIRRGYETYRPSSSKKAQNIYFCDVCKLYIFCSREEHEKSEDHKNGLKVIVRKCTVCEKKFKSLYTFMTHCNTINHRMKFEVQQEKGKKDALEASRNSKKKADKVFVTVDEIGYERDEAERALEKSKLEDGQIPDSEPGTVDSKGSPQRSKPNVASPFAVPNSPAPGEPKNLASLASLVPNPSGDLASPSIDNTLAEMKKDPEPWSMQDLVTFNPNSIVGQEYVIPVIGFFCKLCRKFYNSENSARVIHCKSQAHFINLKKLYEEMQMAAQMAKKTKDSKEEEEKEEEEDESMQIVPQKLNEEEVTKKTDDPKENGEEEEETRQVVPQEKDEEQGEMTKDASTDEAKLATEEEEEEEGVKEGDVKVAEDAKSITKSDPKEDQPPKGEDAAEEEIIVVEDDDPEDITLVDPPLEEDEDAAEDMVQDPPTKDEGEDAAEDKVLDPPPKDKDAAEDITVVEDDAEDIAVVDQPLKDKDAAEDDTVVDLPPKEDGTGEDMEL